MSERTLVREITDKIDSTVVLKGWVETIRDHSKVAFIDLRDRSGVAQLVVSGNLIATARDISLESVVEVVGKVTARPTSLINQALATGTVEVQVESISLITAAKTLPFPLNDRTVNEEVRLKHRYLDFRSNKMKDNLLRRHQLNQFIRQYLTNLDFIEVETPYISKSTPEGARDYLIPSRIMPGNFYALPQSPQQYKQLLMVGGVERYFQIVRCFRDEDARGDRQPEFTQLDIELSFATQEEILKLITELILDLIKTHFPEKSLTFSTPPRLTYNQVMAEYGSDKPDLRRHKDNPDELALAVVVDFPLFEWKETEKRFDSTHHPFTSPKEEFIADFESRPKEALAAQYDLVLNGYEIAGGSVRIHEPDVLERVFKFLGHKKDKITADFGHILEAFTYGVPPHGGVAFGLDRLYAILFNETSIRDVIAFAKSGDGRDLLMNAPSPVDDDQLNQLGLSIKKPKA